MTLQYGLFGGAVNLAPIEAKVERILRDYPECRGLDKQLLVRLWMLEDGLLDLLGDEGLAERFERWFVEQASFPESVTRIRRDLQAKGLYQADERHTARRNGRQQQYHDRYRRR